MHYSLDEQETLIRYEADLKTVMYETNYPPHIKKMLELNCLDNVVTEHDKDVKTGEDRIVSIRGSLKDGFRMPFMPKKKRVLTDAQKKKLMDNWHHTETSETKEGRN